MGDQMNRKAHQPSGFVVCKPRHGLFFDQLLDLQDSLNSRRGSCELICIVNRMMPSSRVGMHRCGTIAYNNCTVLRVRGIRCCPSNGLDSSCSSLHSSLVLEHWSIGLPSIHGLDSSIHTSAACRSVRVHRGRNSI